MKQKIHGHLYDTTTAILVASDEPWVSSPAFPLGLHKKYLYRAESRFFICHKTHWEKTRDFIEPVTVDTAKTLFHRLPVKVQEFGEAFPSPAP
jgi:hypothetical protein